MPTISTEKNIQSLTFIPSSKKSCILGGLGTIGFFLADSLSDQGQEVIVVDNFARGKIDECVKDLLEKKNVRFIKADLTKEGEFKKLPRDCDYIYHLVAINGTKNFYTKPVEVLEAGVLSTFNVLRWMKGQKGKILFSSSNEGYASWIKLNGGPLPTPETVPLCIDDPSNPRWSYAGGKIIGEIAFFNYARTYRFPMVIVRYHNSYGPRMGYDHVIPEFIQKILNKENPFIIHGGKETRAFCYISDTIKATQLAMELDKTNGEILHIGNDQEISMIDLAKKLFKISGFNPEIKVLPAPEGFVPRRCPDITKIKKLGYQPKVLLDEGLKKTWEWYKKQWNKSGS